MAGISIAFAAYNTKIATEIKAKLAEADQPTNEPPRLWSPQQSAVFKFVQHGRGSAFVEAVAGAGKTTTLVHATQLMGGEVRAGTFHSFGISAVRRVYRDTKVADNHEKDDRLVAELKVPEDLQGFTLKLLSLAKQAALGLHGNDRDEGAWWKIVEHHDLTADLEEPDRALEGIRYAWRALKLSKEIASEVIDFDDMIYLPVVTNMRVWQNDWLLVDEAQDTNPVRRALARKMLRPGGRSLWVGDRHQAIYGFTGADADAVDLICREFSCTMLPLTVTYRCPKAVVAAAHEVVDHIQAHTSAPEGTYQSISEDTMWSKDHVASLVPGDAILCRKTAPLLSAAFRLIKMGVACHVEGREIGAGLLKLVNRWKVKNVERLRDRLTDYREQQVSKLLAKGQEAKAEALSDRVDTVLVLAEGCPDVDCVRKKIEDMFKDGAPTLTLSTVHKSKGREWGRVFVLGRNAYMPSPWARQDWMMEQEKNLIYVAYTRAKADLTLINVKGA